MGREVEWVAIIHTSQALYPVKRNRQKSSSRREVREAKFIQIRLLLQVSFWTKYFSSWAITHKLTKSHKGSVLTYTFYNFFLCAAYLQIKFWLLWSTETTNANQIHTKHPLSGCDIQGHSSRVVNCLVHWSNVYIYNTLMQILKVHSFWITEDMIFMVLNILLKMLYFLKTRKPVHNQ